MELFTEEQDQEAQKTAKKERPFFEPGWYPDISNDDYHGSFGYGSTTLKILAEKTKNHMDYQQSLPNTYTEATLKGQALHTLAMEPHLFDKEFGIRPEGLKKPTIAQINAAKPSDKTLVQIDDWDNWLKELGDRTEITAETHDHALKMAKNLREHPQVGMYLEEGIAEQSVYYWYNPEDWDDDSDYRIMCKVRPDWIIPGHSVIFDIKSTRSAAQSDFMKQAKQLGYHMSAGMYLDGVNRCKEFLEYAKVIAFTKFVWLCVENEAPYEVASYEVSDDDREEGVQMYHSLVRKLDQYRRSEWQGYGDYDFDIGGISPATRQSSLPNFKRKIV